MSADLGPMFGPSPDGFSDGPLLRGPTDAEVQTTIEVLKWTAQYTGLGITVVIDTVEEAALDAEGK